MTLVDILKSLYEGAQNDDLLRRYEEKEDNLSELWIKPQNIDEISDKSILVLLDDRPNSLITLAFGFRFGIDLQAKVHVLDSAFHQDLVLKEQEKYDFELGSYLHMDEYGIEGIEKLIDKYNIGFIIVNIRHELTDLLLDTTNIPVFVTKIN